MADQILPLGIHFISIFENNKIVNWEAKQFWEKMQLDGEQKKNSVKAMMYRGLNMLVQNKYLEKRQSPKNKKVNLYTGTSKIEYLISYNYGIEIYAQLDQRQIEIKRKIEDIESKLNYINELLGEGSLKEKHVLKYRIELDKQMSELQLKLEVINSIIDQCHTNVM